MSSDSAERAFEPKSVPGFTPPSAMSRHRRSGSQVHRHAQRLIEIEGHRSLGAISGQVGARSDGGRKSGGSPTSAHAQRRRGMVSRTRLLVRRQRCHGRLSGSAGVTAPDPDASSAVTTMICSVSPPRTRPYEVGRLSDPTIAARLHRPRLSRIRCVGSDVRKTTAAR